MARIDDYRESFRLAGLELKKREPAALGRAAGVELRSCEQGPELIVPYIDNEYAVRFGASVDIIKLGSEDDVSLPEKILIAHYLLGASGKGPAGQLITFHTHLVDIDVAMIEPVLNVYHCAGSRTEEL